MSLFKSKDRSCYGNYSVVFRMEDGSKKCFWKIQYQGSGDGVATGINICKDLPGLKIYSWKVEHSIHCNVALGFYVSCSLTVPFCTVPRYIYGNDT